MKSQKAKKATKNLVSSTPESKYYKAALAALSVNNVQKQVRTTSRVLDRNKIAVA